MLTDVQGGEYMTNDPQWYEDMAKAMKKREHGVQMVKRWTKVINDAQQEIHALSKEPGHTTEPVSVTGE